MGKAPEFNDRDRFIDPIDSCEDDCFYDFPIELATVIGECIYCKKILFNCDYCYIENDKFICESCIDIYITNEEEA